MKAIWNGQIIAESDDTVIVENNHYFPINSVKHEFFQESSLRTTCPWKGVASYYSINVDGKINENAAWFYPVTSDAAKPIEGMVAFWKGVQVEP